MNWRPMVFVEGAWHGNALVFATKEEAEQSAYDLNCRWTRAHGWRADPTDQPVNYRPVDGKLEDVREHSPA